jgi:hypothetical protein
MSVMKNIILELKAKRNGFYQITHKGGWLKYLKDGEPAFDHANLRHTIEKFVNADKPRGAKLFCPEPEPHLNFTMTADKKPCRPEEALERFIVNTNRNYFCNQISIGGRKESIDIGIKASSDKYTFVELKPWKSTNSPMYAIVECLKNLTQYRTILKEGKHSIERFETVNLMVIAPHSYYQQYKLMDGTGNVYPGAASIVSRLLRDIGKTFDTTIILMALNIDRNDFDGKCAQIYDARKVHDQEKVELNESDTIPSLKRNQWKPVATGAHP